MPFCPVPDECHWRNEPGLAKHNFPVSLGALHFPETTPSRVCKTFPGLTYWNFCALERKDNIDMNIFLGISTSLKLIRMITILNVHFFEKKVNGDFFMHSHFHCSNYHLLRVVEFRNKTQHCLIRICARIYNNSYYIFLICVS